MPIYIHQTRVAARFLYPGVSNATMLDGILPRPVYQRPRFYHGNHPSSDAFSPDPSTLSSGTSHHSCRAAWGASCRSRLSASSSSRRLCAILLSTSVSSRVRPTLAVAPSTVDRRPGQEAGHQKRQHEPLARRGCRHGFSMMQKTSESAMPCRHRLMRLASASPNDDLRSGVTW